jgi:hypothetical protein
MASGTVGGRSISLIESYEYEMGVYIREHTDPSTVIISDPETAITMAGLSGREIPIHVGLNLADMQLEDRVKLCLIKSDVLATENASLSASTAVALSEGRSSFIVFSGRTQNWTESPEESDFVQTPISLRESHALTKFMTSPLFWLAHQVDNMIYGFGVNINFRSESQRLTVPIIGNTNRFANVTDYSPELLPGVNLWYPWRQKISGPVVTYTFDGYRNLGGDPPTIRWVVPTSNETSSAYIFVLGSFPQDGNGVFSLSTDGITWVELGRPLGLIYVLRISTVKGSIVFYGRAIHGRDNILGPFVIAVLTSSTTHS